MIPTNRTSIQTYAAILASNIQSLTSHLSKHSELFSKTVVYPSTNYPGRTQEALLLSLLGKKLPPQVETWVEEGREMHAEETADKANEQELWTWANEWIGARVAKYAMEEAGDNYTVEEREMGIENVNTGLRRKLEDDEDDDEDEDEEMEDAGVAVTSVRRMSLGQVEFGMGEVKKDPNGKTRSVEDILRFSTSGVIPNGGLGGKR
jgi:mediator of RNA polymerase II transcription subunit 8